MSADRMIISVYCQFTLKWERNTFGIFWSVLLKRSKRSFICVSWTVYNDDDVEMMLREHEATLKYDGGGKGRSCLRFLFLRNKQR